VINERMFQVFDSQGNAIYFPIDNFAGDESGIIFRWTQYPILKDRLREGVMIWMFDLCWQEEIHEIIAYLEKKKLSFNYSKKDHTFSVSRINTR
jgi:hypothetical protein